MTDEEKAWREAAVKEAAIDHLRAKAQTMIADARAHGFELEAHRDASGLVTGLHVKPGTSARAH